MATIQTLNECSCIKDEKFIDGSSPEYFEDELKAKERFKLAFHEYFQGKQYYAIHLNGKHILTVHIKGFCFCSKCKA